MLIVCMAVHLQSMRSRAKDTSQPATRRTRLHTVRAARIPVAARRASPRRAAVAEVAPAALAKVARAVRARADAALAPVIVCDAVVPRLPKALSVAALLSIGCAGAQPTGQRALPVRRWPWIVPACLDAAAYHLRAHRSAVPHTSLSCNTAVPSTPACSNAPSCARGRTTSTTRKPYAVALNSHRWVSVPARSAAAGSGSCCSSSSTAGMTAVTASTNSAGACNHS